MSIELLSASEMVELRGLFDAFGYSEAGLRAACGVAVPPRRSALPRFLHATREEKPLPLLARAFLAGQAVPAGLAQRLWPARWLELSQQAGLMRTEGDALVPEVVVVPRGDLLFVSDALNLIGSERAAEFTLPAGTHAATYLLNLTLRGPVRSTLDLGTGCGEQALVATAHSGRVFATDINPRATRYAEFNARLNALGNVSCLTGDLFAPVVSERFDLIVANPPFVPGPGGGFVYRDAGGDLDGVCARVVREAPRHLTEGGVLQMLCEWVQVEGESPHARLQSWLEGSGCDCWVLHSPPQPPESYVALRLGEVSGASQGDHDTWMEYFSRHRVRAIHPAALLLRRRHGRNWMHVQPLSREIREPAGEAIARNLAALDFLTALPGPNAFLDARLEPAPELRLEQLWSRTGGAWNVEGVRAWLAGALPLDAHLDAGVAALLREFDGVSTVRECLSRAGALPSGTDSPAGQRALAVVRFFVERGFLRPPAT